MALMRAFKVPYHAYFRMLLNHGLHGADRILSRPAVELMTTNRLTPEQTVAREAMARDNVHISFGQLVGLLLTQVGASTADSTRLLHDFWTTVYQALDN